MTDDSAQSELQSLVRTMQIIVAALCMGVMTFAGVVVCGVIPAQQANANQNVLTLVALAVAVASGVMSVVLRKAVATSNRQKIAAGTWTPSNPQQATPSTDSGKLLMGFQTQTIIAGALLEGGCFMALVAYMIERQTVSLGAAAVLLAGLILHFPTRGRVEAWMDDELRRVNELRKCGS
jgi:hypothetical protein